MPYEKVGKNEPVCIADEVPFEIPESWEWVRLGNIFQHNTGKALNASNRTGSLLPYITTSNLYWDRFELGNLREMYFSENEIEKCTAICDIDEAHIARQIMAIKKMTTLDMPYIRVFLQANFEQIKSKGQGVIPGIDRNSVLNLLFPLPPLLEQRHIVEKQRELFNAITLI